MTISVRYNRYNTHRPQSEESQADQWLQEQESAPALLKLDATDHNSSMERKKPNVCRNPHIGTHPSIGDHKYLQLGICTPMQSHHGANAHMTTHQTVNRAHQ